MSKAAELAALIANVNNGSSLGNKNLLINSSFAVNQRGASTVTSGYFLDRWTITSASATAQLTSGLPDGFSYGMSIAATSGNPIATQRIEAKNLENISGKIVTLSFYAKDLGNVGALYASLQTANSADNFGGTTTISEQTLTSDVPTSWTQYTCSWTVPAAGLNGLALNILCAGSSTFTLGIVAPQLEIGEKATEFEHELFDVTLEKCQRYYQAENYADHYRAMRTTDGKSQVVTKWKKTMRSQPTVTASFENATPDTPINIRESWGFTSLHGDETTDYYFNGWTADAEL